MSTLNSAILNLNNVCRLCGSKIELVWIFDKKFNFTRTMRDIVSDITTVKISKEDIISQKICAKCVALCIKMYQYRDQSVTNDQLLKGQYEELLKIKKDINNTIPSSLLKDYNGPDSSETRPDYKEQLTTPLKYIKTDDLKLESLPKPKPRKAYAIHKSVKDVFKENPQIKLPSITLGVNISPHVTLKVNAVEDYFKTKGLNMDACMQMARDQILTSPKDFSKTSDREIIIKQYLSNSGCPKESLSNFSGRKRKRSNDKYPPMNKMSVENSALATSPISTTSSECSDFYGFSTRCKELYVCHICSSVHYRAKDLKKHQLIHLKCPFCKKKFRTLENKNKHIQFDCKFQKAMKGINNLPIVPLKKIELDEEVRKLYSEAFPMFQPIPELDEFITIKEEINVYGLETSSNDDRDSTEKATNDNLMLPKLNISNGPLNNILIENENRSDIDLLSVLLSEYNKLFKEVNNSTQTTLPTNETIKPSEGNEETIEIKYLKQYLDYYYQIPIEINPGPVFNVSNKYDRGTSVKEGIENRKDQFSMFIKYGEVNIDFAEVLNALKVQTKPIDTTDSVLKKDNNSLTITEAPSKFQRNEVKLTNNKTINEKDSKAKNAAIKNAGSSQNCPQKFAKGKNISPLQFHNQVSPCSATISKESHMLTTEDPSVKLEEQQRLLNQQQDFFKNKQVDSNVSSVNSNNSKLSVQVYNNNCSKSFPSIRVKTILELNN